MIGHNCLADLAAAMLDFRRARSEILPAEMFGEPAWELLLELFVADAKGLELTGADVIVRCNIAPAVLSRWLRYLSMRDLIIGDGTGNLADPLTLSAEGMMSIERTLARADDLRAALIEVSSPTLR